MRTTPQSERKHIIFIGKRNVGKSSLINAFSNQELSIVSDTPGTTTDPVKKAMELLPFGPVVLVDTAGIDDVGELGKKRINKTTKALSSADFVIFVFDSQNELDDIENSYLKFLDDSKIPFICVLNKIDLGKPNLKLLQILKEQNHKVFNVSSSTNNNIFELKDYISELLEEKEEKKLISNLVKKNETVILVMPIDLGAPKGRIILPQVQALRECLDQNAITIVVQETELSQAIKNLRHYPSLVVTDSQAIMKVIKDVPSEVKLTTFSILMAKYKGNLEIFLNGMKEIEKLQNGDSILIAEACTHHEQEDDIGRVKIPNWLRNYTNKELSFDISSGHDFPKDLSKYKFIVHCGGCMLTQTSMQSRLNKVSYLNKPILNYGMLISYIHGAFPRVLEPFPEIFSFWDQN